MLWRVEEVEAEREEGAVLVVEYDPVDEAVRVEELEDIRLEAMDGGDGNGALECRFEFIEGRGVTLSTAKEDLFINFLPCSALLKFIEKRFDMRLEKLSEFFDWPGSITAEVFAIVLDTRVCEKAISGFWILLSERGAEEGALHNVCSYCVRRLRRSAVVRRG